MAHADIIKNMRQILIVRRDSLRRDLARRTAFLTEHQTHVPGDAPGDIVDAALNLIQDDIDSRLAEVESRELMRIEYALERMCEGNYGICDDCGRDIPEARLTALPYATLCIACQRRAEHRQVQTLAQTSE